MKVIKSVFSKIITISIILIIIWYILILGYSLFYKIFGLYNTDYLLETKNAIVFFAKDNMMSPEIQLDEIVKIKKNIKKSDLQIGDIIYVKNGGNYKIVKIEGIKENTDSSKEYITKANKNLYYDPNIKSKDIEGKIEKVNNNKMLIYSIKISISKGFTIFNSVLILLIIYLIIKNENRRTKRKQRREKRKIFEEERKKQRREELRKNRKEKIK